MFLAKLAGTEGGTCILASIIPECLLQCHLKQLVLDTAANGFLSSWFCTLNIKLNIET